jgi:hypothetical protein
MQMSHAQKKTVQIGVERSEFRSFRRSLQKKIDFHPFWDKKILIKNGIPSSHQHLFSKC